MAIRYVAKKYLIDESQFMQTLICESNLRHDAVGDSGKAYGIGQFHKPTWDLFNKERGTALDYYNVRDQLDMMAWAWSKSYQRHWSCWSKFFTH